MSKHLSRGLGETQAAAISWLDNLIANPRGATVVGLIGDLGSGKTTFTQAVAAHLGLTGRVTSPTFVIQKIYNLKDAHWQRLIHIDAYRLHKPEELKPLKWPEIIADPGNLILIEWADQIISVLPKEASKIMFRFVDQDTREISW